MYSTAADFICDICSKHFSSKQALQFHIRTHKKEDPCVCKVCKKTFIRQDCLFRHMKQHHRFVFCFRSKRSQFPDASPQKLPTIFVFLFNHLSRDEVANVITKAEKRKLAAAGSTHPDGSKVKRRKQEQAIVTVDENGDVFEFKITEETQEGEQEEELSQNSIFNIKDEHIEMSMAEIHEDDQAPMFMDDDTLKDSVAKLLDLVVDVETLRKFGWPDASIETVLSNVIEECGQVPADYKTCSDYTTIIRENVKLLFTTVIDNDSIKQRLNNNTIDEVITHVLKLAKV